MVSTRKQFAQQSTAAAGAGLSSQKKKKPKKRKPQRQKKKGGNSTLAKPMSKKHGVYRTATGHVVLDPNAPWTKLFEKIYDKRTVAKKKKVNPRFRKQFRWYRN